MLERLRRELAEKRAKLDAMLAVCDRENRDMTPDEKATIDALIADLTALKDRVDKLEKIEADAEAEMNANRGNGRRSTPLGQGPAIHAGERRRYSYFRAIRAASNGQPLDGLEGEVAQELARRNGPPAQGFHIPLGGNPEIRALMGLPERRDLTTTTGAGLIFNEAEGDMIDLLRGKLVMKELGATIMTGMQGVFSLPRQTGSATFAWLAEGVSASTSNQTFDQVAFLPHAGIAATGLSRLLLNQSSFDAEQMVKNDLAEVVARALDSAAINGPGGTAPLGILQRSGIQSRSAALALGTNGGVPGWNNVVAMETLIATANADQGAIKYLTTPAARGKLKSVAKVVTGATATGSITLWEDGPRSGVGMVNGYETLTSTLVPSTLTKGSGSNLSAIILGYWKDLIISLWDSASLLVNPYSPQLSGGVVISLGLSADVQVKHDESFCFIADAITA